MRGFILLIGVAVFAAMLIVDPVALGRLSYVCATGGCGIRPFWLATGAATVVAILWVLRLLRQNRPAATPGKRAKVTGPRCARRSPRPAATAKPRAAAAKRPKRTP